MSQNPCPKCSADRPGLEDACPNCGWRPEGLKPFPHGNAAAQSRQPVQLGLPFEAVSELSRRKTLWWAYLIAPVVAPASFAVFSFVFGMAALAANPDHTGTPVAVLAVPALSLTVGVVASYLAAGAIGMPIMLLLEKRKRLNGYTIHGAALASSIVFITLSCGLLYALVPAPDTPVLELAAFGAGIVCLYRAFRLGLCDDVLVDREQRISPTVAPCPDLDRHRHCHLARRYGPCATCVVLNGELDRAGINDTLMLSLFSRHSGSQRSR